jgi:hypothetical protein
MDFEEKPGRRDGKPHKGTRRKDDVFRSKESTLTRIGGSGDSSVPDVVNINKHKGWEYVDVAKKEGSIVVEVPNGARSLEMKLEAPVRNKEKKKNQKVADDCLTWCFCDKVAKGEEGKEDK